jgi:hypothetical protein
MGLMANRRSIYMHAAVKGIHDAAGARERPAMSVNLTCLVRSNLAAAWQQLVSCGYKVMVAESPGSAPQPWPPPSQSSPERQPQVPRRFARCLRWILSVALEQECTSNKGGRTLIWELSQFHLRA